MSHALSSAGARDPELMQGLLVTVSVLELSRRQGGSCGGGPASVPSPPLYGSARPQLAIPPAALSSSNWKFQLLDSLASLEGVTDETCVCSV